MRPDEGVDRVERVEEEVRIELVTEDFEAGFFLGEAGGRFFVEFEAVEAGEFEVLFGELGGAGGDEGFELGVATLKGARAEPEDAGDGEEGEGDVTGECGATEPPRRRDGEGEGAGGALAVIDVAGLDVKNEIAIGQGGELAPGVADQLLHVSSRPAKAGAVDGADRAAVVRGAKAGAAKVKRREFWAGARRSGATGLSEAEVAEPTCKTSPEVVERRRTAAGNGVLVVARDAKRDRWRRARCHRARRCGWRRRRRGFSRRRCAAAA